MPEQGDIVLVPVPFTNLATQKRRPVVVISNDRYNNASPDILVAAMTSNPAPTPFGFTISSSDLVAGQLNRPGTVRVDKVFTLEQTLIVKTFGKVDDAVLDRIRAGVRNLLARTP